MESLKEMAPLIAPWVGDSGICADETEKIRKVVNECRRLLWNKVDYTTQMEWACIRCVSGCFFLPSRYDVVRSVIICRVPVSLQNEWYQTVAGGEPRAWDGMNGFRFAEDKGGYHSKFREYVEAPYFIEVQAENNSDKGTQIQFETRDEHGRWGKQVIALEEAFNPARGTLPVVTFNKVTKPKTKGGVRVYAYDPANEQKLLLAIYQAWETNPNFKKYSVPACKYQTVQIKARLSYQDIETENDLVEFPVEAMIHAAMAINKRKARSLQEFTASMTMAVAELQQEMGSLETRGSTPLKMHPMGATDNLILGHAI